MTHGKERIVGGKTVYLTKKNINQDCTRRSLVYEIWCMQCQGERIKRIEEEGLKEEEKKRRIEKIRLHKYVGEMARSTHERAWEHQ